MQRFFNEREKVSMYGRIRCPKTNTKNRYENVIESISAWLYSEPIIELLRAFQIEIHACKKLESDIVLFEEVMSVWNKREDGKERWNIRNGQFVEDNKKVIMECARKLGMVETAIPYFEPDYILPLGGARYTNLVRPKEARYLIDKYDWKNKIVCGLACYREKSAIENESWSEYCPNALTEFDAMSKGLEIAFQLENDFEDNLLKNDNINSQSCIRQYEKKYNGCSCYCLAAPSAEPTRRANTYETVEFLLENFNVIPGKKLLFTTSNIYTITQLLRLIPLALRYNIQIDCVGITDKNSSNGKSVLSADHYLQEIYDAVSAIRKIVKML